MKRWGEAFRFCKLAVPLLALPLLISACSYTPDWADPTEWFEDDETSVPTSNVDDGAEIPNLAEVPSEPRAVSSSEVRQQAVEGLTADSNAQYSDETLVAGSGLPEPQVPAPPSQNGQISSATSTAAVAAVPTVPSTIQPATVQPATIQPATIQPAPIQPAAQALPAYRPPQQSALAAVIYFGHGSAGLDSQDLEVLRGVVAAQRQRNADVMVVGHASARTGNTSQAQHQIANFNISLKRANSVAAALTKLGIASNRVRAEAYSDAQPVYHEFMPTGEAGNRRAEIFLLF